MAIKDAVWRWSYEFQNIFLKNTETFRIPYTFTSIIPLNYSEWEV